MRGIVIETIKFTPAIHRPSIFNYIAWYLHVLVFSLNLFNEILSEINVLIKIA